MASAPYLDQYLNSLENLPVEFHRNSTLMRNLNSNTRKVMCNIDKQADCFMLNIREYSAEKKNLTMTKIQNQYKKAKEYSNDKVQLAKQTYELVDKYIRKLDADLSRFEIEIQERANSSRRNLKSAQKWDHKKIKHKEIENKTSSVKDEVVIKTSKKKQLKNASAKGTNVSNKTSSVNDVVYPKNLIVASVLAKNCSPSGTLEGSGLHSATDVLDMPVDPNEPTYCLCNQVSFGEMIGCDNPDCPIEWFHFECVKIVTKPKGKWFCPQCITHSKKNKTTF